MTELEKEVTFVVPPAFLVPRTDLSITQSTSAQRVTSVLLNGQNFHAWSRSLCLYLGGRWIIGKEPRPTVSDPKTGWEELAQNELFSDFPTDTAVESKHLDRRHTYQLLVGLKPKFEALQTQIVNTSPMPFLYKAFATVDGDERRRRLLPPTLSPELSPPVPDQMVFVAPSGSRPTGNRSYCQHCRKPGHVINHCFDLHPELKQRYSWNRDQGNKDQGKWAPRTGVISKVAPAPSISDYSQLQSQIAQLQSHLGLDPTSFVTISSANPIATLATGIPTALHTKSGNPTWILDFGANNHMTGPASKKIFGRGYERDGLYYFGDPPSSKVSSSSLQASVLPVFDSSFFSSQTLDLWHAHLRHANFQYLCWLFPPLNKASIGFNVETVQYNNIKFQVWDLVLLMPLSCLTLSVWFVETGGQTSISTVMSQQKSWFLLLVVVVIFSSIEV
ncbi:hypothetical protein HHK36_021181 [Tetracentron sinense]|uniref:Retrotransposon Copia-like N-terminal domain-containing protein n=1 Tax=Tetracentron sinense TaxID=13715 RepID=A0A835D7K6_TETSI|nr:hypothetical protein HHK36_021181 [Tetracentron sinense]